MKRCLATLDSSMAIRTAVIITWHPCSASCDRKKALLTTMS